VGEAPPTRQFVARHDAVVTSEEGAAGTSSTFHVPFDSRYSPTLVGAVLEPVVPTAMHEPDVVHAVTRKGTEMPIDGTPETCSTDCVVQLARARALAAVTTLNHHALRAFTARLFIVVCVLS